MDNKASASREGGGKEGRKEGRKNRIQESIALQGPGLAARNAHGVGYLSTKLFRLIESNRNPAAKTDKA